MASCPFSPHSWAHLPPDWRLKGEENSHLLGICVPGHVLGAQVPLLDWWFLAQGTGFMEDSFSMDGEWADSLGMIQVQYIYYVLYFYYYYVSSTSDHEALDPAGGGSLL